MSKLAKLLKRTAESVYKKMHVNIESAFVALFRIDINVSLLLESTVLKSGICKIIFDKVHMTTSARSIGRHHCTENYVPIKRYITDTNVTVVLFLL